MQRRIFGRSRAFASLACALLRIPFWLGTPTRTAKARRLEQAFFAQILRGFGITVETRGDIVRSPATLFVMNHISWADIPVMLALLDADFVAKSDIASWPLIGPLARRFAPVFVERKRTRRCHLQAGAIAERLRLGRSVILCPEGTTSDGTDILPFRSSLFDAASYARQIQPVALRYCETGGMPLSPQRMREVAWIADDSLASGAARVARTATCAEAMFLDAITLPQPFERKAFAQAIHRQIAIAYAAAQNRSL